MFDEEVKTINSNDKEAIKLSTNEEKKQKTFYLKLYILLFFSIILFLLILRIILKIYFQCKIIFKRNLDIPQQNGTNSNFSLNKQNLKDDFQKLYEDFNKENSITPNDKLKYFTPKEYGVSTFKLSFNYSEEIHKQLFKKVNSSKIAALPKEKEKLSFALCAIGKLENLYARDFVIYYLELGIDKIYIYDNNEIYSEKFETVLSDFIDDDLVEIIDFRGNQTGYPQNQAYDKCYQAHKEEYDWLLFFDFDEYLYLEKYSLNDFVQLSKFDKCDSIVFYWRHYTDNNELYYKSESPIQRFTEPITEEFQRNKFLKFANVKSMSRGRINDLTYSQSIHVPYFLNITNHLTCNSKGDEYNRFNKNKTTENELTYENGFIKHFQWRSTEEFCIKLAVKKFFKSYNWGSKDYNYLKNIYLKLNEKMKEKTEMIRNCVDKML